MAEGKAASKDEVTCGATWQHILGMAYRRKKSVSTEHMGDDSKKYSLFDLLCIGIGSTVGSGVFVLTGDVLQTAGPSSVLSWIIAGCICGMSALSYIELSSRIPSSGSCYVFSYHSLGEAFAVVASALLTFEYGISGAGVARSWSELVSELTGAEKDMFWWYPGLGDPSDPDNDMYCDPVGALMMALCVAVVTCGVSVGKVVINAFTVAKVVTVAYLIIFGFAGSQTNIVSSVDVTFPKGAAGLLHATSMLFFGFIGFDEVCCMAGKSVNPKKTMPIALAGTLLGAMVISALAQAALCSMTPAEYATTSTTWPQAFDRIGWETHGKVINVAMVTLLPIVVLLSFLPQPELMGTMAEDGLIPRVFGKKTEAGTYAWGSIMSGAVMVLLALFVPFSILWDVINVGVLLSFNLTNTSLIMLRYGNGGKIKNPRMIFCCTFLWIVAAIGGYSLWLGVLFPAFNNEEVSTLALVASFSGLALTMIMAVVIMFAFTQVPPSDDAFRVPCVPIPQALAIFLNFALMANADATSHLFLLVVVAICLCTYFIFSVLSFNYGWGNLDEENAGCAGGTQDKENDIVDEENAEHAGGTQHKESSTDDEERADPAVGISRNDA